MKNTVLIADDSMFMRTILKRTLKKLNYNIIAEASDGEEAIEKYKKFKPEYTFLDITMNKKSGLEVLSEIIKENKEAKVLICSAMGQKSFIMEALQNGARDFIVKPFKEETIKRALENLK